MTAPALQNMSDKVVAEQLVSFTFHSISGTQRNGRVCYKTEQSWNKTYECESGSADNTSMKGRGWGYGLVGLFVSLSNPRDRDLVKGEREQV